MSNKELVMETLRRLPEEATLEEISEQIAILAAIRRGEAAAAEGRLSSQEEVKQRTGMAAPCLRKKRLRFGSLSPTTSSSRGLLRFIALSRRIRKKHKLTSR